MRYEHRRTGRLKTVEPGTRHQRQLDAHRAWRLVDDTTPPDPAPKDRPRPPQPPEGDRSSNEVRHAGGPWFDVYVAGEPVDKVQGRDAAEARLAELTDG